MRTILWVACLCAALGFGAIAEGVAADNPVPKDEAQISEGWHHGRGHRRGGRNGDGRRGCWSDDDRGRDDGWRCGGGYYHRGPDRDYYQCH